MRVFVCFVFFLSLLFLFFSSFLSVFAPTEEISQDSKCYEKCSLNSSLKQQHASSTVPFKVLLQKEYAPTYYSYSVSFCLAYRHLHSGFYIGGRRPRVGNPAPSTFLMATPLVYFDNDPCCCFSKLCNGAKSSRPVR